MATSETPHVFSPPAYTGKAMQAHKSQADSNVLKGGWFFKNPKENRSFQQISNCLALF
jgi:hypothetical protein